MTAKQPRGSEHCIQTVDGRQTNGKKYKYLYLPAPVFLSFFAAQTLLFPSNHFVAYVYAGLSIYYWTEVVCVQMAFTKMLTKFYFYVFMYTPVFC